MGVAYFVQGDRIRINGKRRRVHRVRYATDSLLVYGWRDVVAQEITCYGVRVDAGAQERES